MPLGNLIRFFAKIHPSCNSSKSIPNTKYTSSDTTSAFLGVQSYSNRIGSPADTTSIGTVLTPYSCLPPQTQQRARVARARAARAGAAGRAADGGASEGSGVPLSGRLRVQLSAAAGGCECSSGLCVVIINVKSVARCEHLSPKVQ